jgi:hypothetical protein
LQGPTLYDVLRVSPVAKPETVEAAYRRLARTYHPDGSPAAGSAGKMAELNAAYQVLRDPTRRAAYDASIGLHDAAARRRGRWHSRIGLAAGLVVLLVVAAYVLSEPGSERDERANLQATEVARANAALTAQVLREAVSGDQVQPGTTPAAATLEIQAALGTPEALSADGTRQLADTEAPGAAISAQAAPETKELRPAGLAETSEALAARANRESEQDLARPEVVQAEAMVGEAGRQVEELAAGPAQPALPEPLPSAQSAATPAAPPCIESDRMEFDGLLLEPLRRSDTVEYFGRGRVRNGCDKPVRIQLVFEALGADGTVVLNGQTRPLVLAPGQASEVNDSIGFRPRADVASFQAFASITDAGGN